MEQRRQKNKIARQVMTFWKEDKMERLLLHFQIHPKVGLVWSFPSLAVLNCLVTPSMCSRAFTLLIPPSAVLLDPHGGRGWKWWESKEKESRAGCGKMWIFMLFLLFFCLPVILTFNGLPKPPQLPSRETLGDSTQLRFLPRLSCGRRSQSKVSALGFQNLNIPKWSFQKRAPVEANASAVQLWGRQWGTRGLVVSRKQG